jgi:phage replication-related protein YjqB (UPF0714/DUF867 family)
MDRYSGFDELRQCESEFTIEVRDRGADITIIAPHGGRIEPQTSDIARLIAGDDCNLYCFNGTKPGCNQDLHITSHRYDETRALQLVGMASTAVSVHGCKRPDPYIYLGGRDIALTTAISQELQARDIRCSGDQKHFAGSHRNNICNRCRSGRGVQLEVSRALRNSHAAWPSIADAVRTALFSRLCS